MASSITFRRVLLTSRSRIITTSHPLRTLTTTSSRKTADNNDNSNKHPSMPFASAPAPPRLPKEEQEIFESLQKQSTGAFSTPKINQSPHSEETKSSTNAEIKASGNGEELHPDFKGALQPEFKGEKNPKTGEIGGPKNEPLRWGAQGDWSYGGRVTDF